MKKAILFATSDLITDQRVHRTAITLQANGYTVVAVGRRLRTTPKEISVSYKIRLYKLPFRKGPLFYATYNIAAFFYLLFKRYCIAQANDLDTLPAVKLACVIRRKPLVYDSHELFTEVPELINRRYTQGVWRWLEKKLISNSLRCSTVSNGVALELKRRYGVEFKVIRNLPVRKPMDENYYSTIRKTIIYQGALNIGRGLEKLITAMQYLPDCKLVIVGSGDIESKLKLMTKGFSLGNRISFLGRIPLEQLHNITVCATVGVSIEEDLGLSYRYALPNKVFDYIQAGLPVIVSDLPEMKELVTKYNIGRVIRSNSNAQQLAIEIDKLLNDNDLLLELHKNSISAAEELCWEVESHKLVDLFSDI